MDRRRIVDARADAGAVEVGQHGVPGRYPNHVQVPDVLVARGDDR
jgi:hypothetical protein